MTHQHSAAAAPPASGEVEVWSPGTVVGALWTVLGTLLSPVGIVVFAALDAAPTGGAGGDHGEGSGQRQRRPPASFWWADRAPEEVRHLSR